MAELGESVPTAQRHDDFRLNVGDREVLGQLGGRDPLGVPEPDGVFSSMTNQNDMTVDLAVVCSEGPELLARANLPKNHGVI